MRKPDMRMADEKAARTWLKQLGWALPLFFLLKGLLWLSLPLITAYFAFE